MRFSDITFFVFLAFALSSAASPVPIFGCCGKGEPESEAGHGPGAHGGPITTPPSPVQGLPSQHFPFVPMNPQSVGSASASTGLSFTPFAGPPHGATTPGHPVVPPQSFASTDTGTTGVGLGGPPPSSGGPTLQSPPPSPDPGSLSFASRPTSFGSTGSTLASTTLFQDPQRPVSVGTALKGFKPVSVSAGGATSSNRPFSIAGVVLDPAILEESDNESG